MGSGGEEGQSWSCEDEEKMQMKEQQERKKIGTEKREGREEFKDFLSNLQQKMCSIFSCTIVWV